MKPTPRYFRSGEEIWKFQDGRHPLLKTPGRQRWVEGTLMNLEELRRAHPDATEIPASEAEIQAVDLTKERVGLW